MIHDLCPNGVEWKTLGEVCTTIIAPKKLDKKYYLPKGLYPIIDQGQKYIIAYTNDEEALLPSAEYVLFGDHTREIKYVDFAFAQGADGVKILQADTDILPKYLYYAMSNLQIPSRGYNRHWSIAKDLSIPIPPLEVQAEIVNLLDKFTQLSAELKAELKLRRKQYDYYRNHLLSFDSNSTTVQWMPLGEVAEISRGVRVVRNDLQQNGYPVYQNSLTPLGYYNSFNTTANTTFVISAGAAGKIGFSIVDFWAADDCLRIICQKKLNSKYLYYCILTMKLILADK